MKTTAELVSESPALAEQAMAEAMKQRDFSVFDEIEDAVDCLRAAIESYKRRKPQKSNGLQTIEK